MGHAAIELIVSTYRRWLTKKALGVLDRLDISVEVTSGSSSEVRNENGPDSSGARAVSSSTYNGAGDPD
jgi:hypothetical protein